MVQVPEWAVVIFIVATLVGIILQAAVLLGMLMAARAAMKRVNQVTELAQEHAVPLLRTARRMLEENSDNVKTIVGKVKDTTTTVADTASKVADAANRHVEPTMATIRRTVDENSPRVKIIVDNVAEMTETIKSESSHVGETLDALLKKTEQQADRVDEMVSGTLNSISHATATLQKAVVLPVRQVGAVLSGLRAGIGFLFTHNNHNNHNHDHYSVGLAEDDERFV
ncbi:MAG TPA: hypothetical protein VJS11_00115 [Acidobacteriaceae bacterium]|nr:hypothetical protein [Acidobacteriaceae bacterium]